MVQTGSTVNDTAHLPAATVQLLGTGNSEAYPDNIDGWVKKTFDIPEEFIGNTDVRIRFRFERNCCTTSDGWWIDDIRVIQEFSGISG